MKAIIPLTGLLVVTALFVVGCQPSDDSTPSEAAPPMETAAEPAMEPAEPSMDQTLSETAEAAKQALDDANAKAQEILTQAQRLVNEQQYQEAGNLLQKLGDFELTPEQEKLLEDLKATIQKALQSEAVKEGSKAIGNLLGGDK